MDEGRLRDYLEHLDPDGRIASFFYFKYIETGKTNKDIGDVVNRAESTIETWNTNVLNEVNKFGYTGIDDNVKNVFLSIAGTPPPPEGRYPVWPPRDYTRPEPQPRTSGILAGLPENRRFLLIFGILGSIALIAGGVLLAREVVRRVGGEAAEFIGFELPSPESTAREAADDQATVDAIVQLTIAAFPTDVPVFSSEPTERQTEEPTPDIDATVALAVAATAEQLTAQAPPAADAPNKTPAISPTPTPSALFEDDFNEGLSNEWVPVSGILIVVNDMLTAEENAWVLVGDSSWTDYTIEFDGNAQSCRGDSFLAVRLQDLENMIVFSFAHCETFWYIVENGEWNDVPNANTGNIGNGWSSFRIIVEGDEFTFYDDGDRKTSFNDSRFPQGGVGLMVRANAQVDNFLVRPMQN